MEGQEVIDSIQLTEVGVKKKKGRLTDVMMEELEKMTGVDEHHSCRGE